MADKDTLGMIPMKTKPPTITVQFTPEDFDRIHQFAYRAGMSVAQVAKLGIVRLMVDAETGVIKLLPEFADGIPTGHA
jgi:hypothetical protein